MIPRQAGQTPVGLSPGGGFDDPPITFGCSIMGPTGSG